MAFKHLWYWFTEKQKKYTIKVIVKLQINMYLSPLKLMQLSVQKLHSAYFRYNYFFLLKYAKVYFFFTRFSLFFCNTVHNKCCKQQI